MSTHRAVVLVVDDEPSVTDLLSTVLEEEGHDCITAATGEDALKKLAKGNVGVALLDLTMPGMSGMDVLRAIKSDYPETAVIVVTATRDADTAVEAMKIGALDYITKPFNIERVIHSVEAALRVATTREDNSTTRAGDIRTDDERPGWTRYLDDVAEGVEARLNSLTGHMMTMTVIERTVGIARSLGVPENQIDKWVNARRKQIEQSNILGALL